MRLYLDLHEDPLIFREFCDLSCNDSNLDLCDVRNLAGTPMVDAKEIFPRNWRFFPSLDPMVSILTCSSLEQNFFFFE